MKDIFEKHAQAQTGGYYKDSRWKKVKDLQKKKLYLAANGLVFKIREDWGL